MLMYIHICQLIISRIYYLIFSYFSISLRITLILRPQSLHECSQLIIVLASNIFKFFPKIRIKFFTISVSLCLSLYLNHSLSFSLSPTLSPLFLCLLLHFSFSALFTFFWNIKYYIFSCV